MERELCEDMHSYSNYLNSRTITNSIPGLYAEPILMAVFQARNESRGLVRTNVNVHKIHILAQSDKSDTDTSYWGSSVVTKPPLQSNRSGTKVMDSDVNWGSRSCEGS